MSEAIAAERLKAFLERVERLEEEKQALADDIKEVYAESKGAGFDPKIMRMIVKMRKKAREKLQEEEELLKLYREAVGV